MPKDSKGDQYRVPRRNLEQVPQKVKDAQRLDLDKDKGK